MCRAGYWLLLHGVLYASDVAKPAGPYAAPAPAPKVRLSVASAAAARNENVQVSRIDNEAKRELNIRLGSQYMPVLRAGVEVDSFSSEHGVPPSERAVILPANVADAWHGELFEYHQNSVFNSRTFFQVGPVRPSRQNRFGGRFTGRAGAMGWLSGSHQQNKIRGMVNGNVLVPLASERTPLTRDPAAAAIIQRWLDAYPRELPNRPDFDPRALNTNSPQRIDELTSSLRLDRHLGQRHHLTGFHLINRQRVSAFQLVAGQNPDMDVHNHRSRLGWHTALTASTALDAGAGFTRVRSSLRPEPNAVGPRVRVGYQWQELGPDSHFPIDRAQNSFHGGALVSRHTGAHQWTAGGDAYRFQYNGAETLNERGEFGFTNNFGRLGIENLRLGTPSYYLVNLGEFRRGFRNAQFNLFFGDQWKARPGLQVYWGVRYSAETAPFEVNGREMIPYDCDCNNLSPRLSLAWEAPRGWLVRTGYTVSYSQIPAVTYGQVRNNLPGSRYVQIQNPDSIVAPLRNLAAQGRSAPIFLARELTSPYAHQYGLTMERRWSEYVLRLGYVGSRTIKLLNTQQENRAGRPEGIPVTLDTVDARRADPRYYDVVRVVNAGIAYLDAAQVTWEAPYRRGLAWGATYTFSKAIDEGVDYTATAASREVSRGRSQFQDDLLADRKGLSNFDSPHALLVSYAYDLPRPALAFGLPGWLVRDWSVSGAGLLKKGTPLTLFVGSDAPGFGNVDGGASDRPNVLDPTILGMTIGNPDIAARVMTRDRFAYIRPGEVRGNIGRNTLRKGAIRNLNLGLNKRWKWGAQGERSLLFRAEATNLTNTPQFDEPQRNLTSPSFGRITNTLNDGRVLQFGLRFLL
jgi:hypothetical protein